MFIFGLGYTASRLARHLRHQGWHIDATGTNGNVDFSDEASVKHALGAATHILSSVPPAPDGHDPVLQGYEKAIVQAPAQWVGYLSSTGVYGNSDGAWVDEGSPTGTGRRKARTRADHSWQNLHSAARVFRLPGIYGPGRSALDRVADGRAKRIALSGQIFSRIHVDDIVGGIVASFSGPAGTYNLADNRPCAQNCVIEAACDLLGVAPPPLLPLEEADLSPTAREFYSENRRVANGRAKRKLGWAPIHPDYWSGLRACLIETDQ